MRHVVLVVVGFLVAGCSGSPTAPPAASGVRAETLLATGRWSSGPACLTVTETTADLYAGCWHGQFTRPRVGGDGTFSADGTYRFEAGPVRDESGPAARFSGSISGDTLTLTVEPADKSAPATSYEVSLGGPGECVPLCR